jgi:C1A family cysteine protease
MSLDRFGFDASEVEAIKDLLIKGLENGMELEEIFPGQSELAEEASVIYLTMKYPDLHWHFGTSEQPPDPDDPELGDLPTATSPTVDLRPYFSPVEAQGPVNCCWPCAAIGVLEMMAKRATGAYRDLSKLYVYYNGRVEMGTVDEDSGLYARCGAKGLKKYGACAEQIWPYDTSRWNLKPFNICYTDIDNAKINNFLFLKKGDLQAVVNTIASGYPVLVGMDVSKEFMGYEVMKTGVLPMPADPSTNSGGHEIVLGGYDTSRQVFFCRNSWGQLFGKNGWFEMPFLYYSTYTFDPLVLSI